VTWSLEAHVVDHCNLRCAHCCTLSPGLQPRYTSPAALRRDLTLAARAVAPALLKLTGGEPLLHPELAACLDASRESGIADQISLTTNGHLAHRVSDAVFERLDRLTLSLYPSAPLSDARLAALEERCERHGVLLRVKWMHRFGRMDAPRPSARRARAVHAECWLRVRCHLVHEGRFYACTRPPHLADVRGEPELAQSDGVSLEAPDLLERVRALLESDEPHASCSVCLGASGAREPHSQLAAGSGTSG